MLFVYISFPPLLFFFLNSLVMATPLFQPSHLVGNLIYLLFFFFFKERKKKKNEQNLKLFFCCSYGGDSG